MDTKLKQKCFVLVADCGRIYFNGPVFTTPKQAEKFQKNIGRLDLSIVELVEKKENNG